MLSNAGDDSRSTNTTPDRGPIQFEKTSYSIRRPGRRDSDVSLAILPAKPSSIFWFAASFPAASISCRRMAVAGAQQIAQLNARSTPSLRLDGDGVPGVLVPTSAVFAYE